LAEETLYSRHSWLWLWKSTDYR